MDTDLVIIMTMLIRDNEISDEVVGKQFSGDSTLQKETGRDREFILE